MFKNSIVKNCLTTLFDTRGIPSDADSGGIELNLMS